MNKLLEQVITFSEACELLGQNQNYMTDLVKSGKLVEGEDYRKAGRIGLTTKFEVERIRLRGQKYMGKNRDFNLMANESILVKGVKDLVTKLYEIVKIAEDKGLRLKTFGDVMDIAGQRTSGVTWTYRHMIENMQRYCNVKLHLKDDILSDLISQLEESGLINMTYMEERDSVDITQEEQLLADAFQYFLMTLGRL